jgi:hypothetical protein
MKPAGSRDEGEQHPNGSPGAAENRLDFGVWRGEQANTLPIRARLLCSIALRILGPPLVSCARIYKTPPAARVDADQPAFSQTCRVRCHRGYTRFDTGSQTAHPKHRRASVDSPQRILPGAHCSLWPVRTAAKHG